MAVMATLSLASFLLCLFSTFPSYHSTPLAPDMTTCSTPTGLPSSQAFLNCCAPTSSSPPTPFHFRSSDLAHLRIRRPSHAADLTYAVTLARGYSLMRALPPEDPRSFMQQANIHCAYCNSVYSQVNSTESFYVHGNWLFFAFHRWYLYFHERILGKLLGDDTFALSFWNYDHPNGSTIPWMFTEIKDLVDECRDPLHQPPSVVAIDYAYDTDGRSREQQIEANANEMYRIMIKAAKTQRKFFGKPFKHGDGYVSSGLGTVEWMPHNTVHLWTGHRELVDWTDMGNFYAAARDPVFYTHHSSLDRLWEVWKSFEGNTDMDDPAYLDSEFAFYDENAKLVSVKVRDAFNTTKLGYVYEDVENLWISKVPVRLSTGVAALTENDSICSPGVPILEPCSVKVDRDPERASKGWEEDLMLAGIKWNNSLPVYIDIFINLPTATTTTTKGCVEYVSVFFQVPQFSRGFNETSFTVDIGDNVRDLELTEEFSVIVTIVPRALLTMGTPASIDSFAIDYSNFTASLPRVASM